MKLSKEAINKVIKYKETKSHNDLNQAIQSLMPIIKWKASYVFYRQVVKIRDKYIVLHQTKLVELNDIEQELAMTIVSLIEKYNPSKPFKNYFYSSIWNWTPDFIRSKDFISRLYMKNESELPDHNDYFINNKKINNILDNLIKEDDELTEEEEKIIILYIENNKITQEEVAKKLGITQQAISLKLKDLRKKMNKFNP